MKRAILKARAPLTGILPRKKFLSQVMLVSVTYEWKHQIYSFVLWLEERWQKTVREISLMGMTYIYRVVSQTY